MSDGANYYELSYSPLDLSTDAAKYRKIAVAVTRPGLNVISRDGYFPVIQPAPVAETEDKSSVVGEIKFDLSSAALNRLKYSGLKVTAKKTASEEYTVSIAADGLMWRDEAKGHVAELSMMAVCFSIKDKPLCKAASEHTASTEGDIAQIKGDLTYKLPFNVPVGTTRIRIVVRDLDNGKMGSVEVVPR
jgi:hypothetical protein